MNTTKNQRLIWGVSIGVALILLILVVCAVKLLVSDDGSKRKRQVKMVTIVKPPPPPKVQEKPPEPEVKKEEILEPELEEQVPEESPNDNDAPPPGEDLGLDSDGTSGSDGFGLKAKKGGRPIIGGGSGASGFGWYTRLLINEIQQLVNKEMQKKGGVPEGGFKSLIRLELDDMGTVIAFHVINASGDSQVDQAIQDALITAMISEPPPVGMPRQLNVRITPKG